MTKKAEVRTKPLSRGFGCLKRKEIKGEFPKRFERNGNRNGKARKKRGPAVLRRIPGERRGGNSGGTQGHASQTKL